MCIARHKPSLDGIDGVKRALILLEAALAGEGLGRRLRRLDEAA